MINTQYTKEYRVFNKSLGTCARCGKRTRERYKLIVTEGSEFCLRCCQDIVDYSRLKKVKKEEHKRVCLPKVTIERKIKKAKEITHKQVKPTKEKSMTWKLKKPELVDWGMANALRKAGWSFEGIAIEIGATEQEVIDRLSDVHVTVRKERDWEFSNHEPYIAQESSDLLRREFK